MKNVQNVVVVQQREPVTVGLISMLLLAGVIALIIQYFWYIVILALVGFVSFVFWLLLRDHQLRARSIAVRADEQNRMFLAGDPRGMYGDFDEGLEQR